MVPDSTEVSIEHWLVDDAVQLNGRRLSILDYLSDQERPFTLSDLANAIVEAERGSSAIGGGDETVERLQVSLHHIDLPLLDQTDLLDYDSKRWIISPTDGCDEVPTPP